ncbi:MAG TPA: hypothetical protein VJN96_03935 [Vicinamibacterales bacterium]|nr:hypothetical protein [Vicinamibacterales bacterium]
MTVQFVLAARGVLAEWHRVPPPFPLLIAASVMLAVVVASSAIGARAADRLSFAALIGYQSFRLPLELVMHRAASDGLMPVQMSFSGWNFDILTGLTAIPVAILASRGRATRGLIVAWNLLGSLLLVNIVSIAVASLPTFAAFGPDRLNTWVADPPYVWLPGVLVPAALFGHLLTWRKLARAPRDLLRRA